MRHILPCNPPRLPSGCFDREEDAARAYDRMMLWIEMHSAGATKAGVTNFEVSQYAGDLGWLANVTQVRLRLPVAGVSGGGRALVVEC